MRASSLCHEILKANVDLKRLICVRLQDAIFSHAITTICQDSK